MQYLEITEYNGEGYKPMVRFDTWRVAVVNYAERFDEKNFTCVEIFKSRYTQILIIAVVVSRKLALQCKVHSTISYFTYCFTNSMYFL